MKTTDFLLQEIDNPLLSNDERVKARCEIAFRFQEIGNYDGAKAALGELWTQMGTRPNLNGLKTETIAEVLLRSGSLTSEIGSSRQISNAQNVARDLLKESASLFKSIGLESKYAETQIELAWSYYHEGGYTEAKNLLENSVSLIEDSKTEIKALALLRIAEIDRVLMRYSDALNELSDVESLLKSSSNHLLKGKYHITLALILRNLSVPNTEQYTEYIDKALIDYTAASFHFEEAGHIRYRAAVENNIGYLLYKIGRFTEAEQHYQTARTLFAELLDDRYIAQVDDSKARLYIALGRYLDAERLTRAAIRKLEKGGPQALLSEVLITHGIALAKLGEYDQAREAIDKAEEIASSLNNNELAGKAALTILEELPGTLPFAEASIIYKRAKQLLRLSDDPEIHARLRKYESHISNVRTSNDQKGKTDFAENNLSSLIEKLESIVHRMEVASSSFKTVSPQKTYLSTLHSEVSNEVSQDIIHLSDMIKEYRPGETINQYLGRVTIALIEEVRAKYKNRKDAAKRLGIAPNTMDQRLRYAHKSIKNKHSE